MGILNFILLAFAHYMLGWGILKAIGIKEISASIQYTVVCLLFGLGLSSLLPVILEIFSIPIHKTSLFITIVLSTILPAIFWIKEPRQSFSSILKAYSKNFRLYDLVFIIVLLYLLLPGILKCVYYPPVPRDLTSGAEAIAEYTLKEQHINNSYFSVDLSSTDNYQKPPFLLGLQIIYKMYVQPFGQVWLILFGCGFFSFLYVILRKMVHPVLAGLATILVLAIPEFYPYTVVLPLYDFPCTVYLLFGFYYLFLFIKDKDKQNLWLSSVGFGMATLVRPETIFLVLMICISYYISQIIASGKVLVKTAFLSCCILLLTALVLDVFTMEIFVKHFIPSKLEFGNKFTSDLSNLAPLYRRWELLTEVLMFTKSGAPNNLSQPLYAETFNVMVVFIVIELAFVFVTRKINFNAACWFGFMVLVFILLLLIGYLLPFTEFTNAKRGLFKMIPLIFIFVVNTRAVQYFSQKIVSWESGK